MASNVSQKKPKKQGAKAPREQKAPKTKRGRALLGTGSLFVKALDITREDALDMLRKMYRIRHFEEKVFELVSDNKVGGASHVYSGQEAVAVGACSVLRDDDMITSTHRGHGHCIAWDGDVKLMLAELAGKAAGYCRGKGGSMHIADVDAGNLGATGIVGGNIPVAVGAALACKFNKKGQVVACFFGDGAANNGTFHEAVNLAAIWDLPVLFICENNQYGMSFPAAKAFRAGNIYSRGAAYGIEGVKCDGMRILDVRETVETACVRARAGKGPTLIEAVTYRYRGHSRSDPQSYRSKEEVQEWKKKDPLEQFKIILYEAQMLTPEENQVIELKIAAEIKSAVKFALEDSPYPDIDQVLADVYKGWIEGPMGLTRQI